MCCMICVDVLKEKLTYREVDSNCKELTSLPSEKKGHYHAVHKAVINEYFSKSREIREMSKGLDEIVPKEAIKSIENT